MTIITNLLSYIGTGQCVVILAAITFGCIAAAVFVNNMHPDIPDTDESGINAIPAEWPSDSLSREYGKEFEPRGM